MNSELVELVVQLYEKNWGVRDYGLARAVVAMCMEEAARVADAKLDRNPSDDFDTGWDAACFDISAAIRALATDPGPGGSRVS